MKKVLVLFIFVTFIINEVGAQSFFSNKRDRKFIASVGTGTTSYFGELNNPSDRFDTKLNLNFGLQMFVAERISVRSEVTWFQLKGTDEEADDSGRLNRNLSFTSNNFEFNVEGIIYLFPKGARYYQRKQFNVYAFAGIGIMNYNPAAKVPDEFNGVPLDGAGKNIGLRSLQTEGVKYGAFTPVIPIGIGIKYKIGPFFNLSLEGGHRKTFTDYLDDVSTVYVDNGSFSDPVAAALADRSPEIGLSTRSAGSKRGNPDKDDAYFIMNVKVEYYLPPSFNLFKAGPKRPGMKKYRRVKRR